MNDKISDSSKSNNPIADNIVADYDQYGQQHGNDLDFLAKANILFMQEHYLESINLSRQVLPPQVPDKTPSEFVNKAIALATLIAAIERALPLFEQAAMDIEGHVNSSLTMSSYFAMLDGVRGLQE